MAPLKHPSGRPKRPRKKIGKPVPNVPNDEPLTPGLRRDRNVEAIGFHVAAGQEQENEE